MLLDDKGLQERVARMETLLGEIETLKDPNARSKAAEVVGVLLDLYGDGLARMMEVVAEGEERERNFEAFARDELVSHLLLLHGLHPLDVEARVVAALEEVRPYLQSHGGNVELLGIEGGVVRVRMEGSCDGCPSSAMTLKLAIEEAVLKAAPDLEGVEAEGMAEEPPPKPTTTFVAGPTLRRKEKKPPEETGASWTVVGGLPQLLRGSLKEAELTCSGCGHRYDVRRAGRCLDHSQLHLEPIPLLVNEEVVEERQGLGRRSIVKIALPSAVG
jgi:Fe-S cluster biogenesis protein NfuA